MRGKTTVNNVCGTNDDDDMAACRQIIRQSIFLSLNCGVRAMLRYICICAVSVGFLRLYHFCGLCVCVDAYANKTTWITIFISNNSIIFSFIWNASFSVEKPKTKSNLKWKIGAWISKPNKIYTEIIRTNVDSHRPKHGGMSKWSPNIRMREHLLAIHCQHNINTDILRL